MRLLYLVDEYPFRTREHFPSLECPFLCRAFDEVVVVPARPGIGGGKIQYDLPANARVVPEVSLEVERRRKAGRQVRGRIASKYGVMLLAEVLRGRGRRPLEVLDVWAGASIFAAALESFVSLDHFDLICSFWADTPLLGLVMARSCGKPLPMVTRLHNFDLYPEATHRSRIPFQSLIARSLDRLYPCSRMGEGYLQRKFPRSADRIEARYLGVEIPPQEAPRSTDGILRVVSCGFVEPIKRTDRIEEALTRVKRRVHWTHFGDGSLFPALSAAVRTLPPHVSVDLKGFRPNREVIDFYSAQPVDLFLNLSSMEGIPVAIMEAMSFGIPCLATAVGGTPELVGTGNGYLVPSDPSPGAIASILDNHAIDSPEKRRAARATIEERFNAARNFAEFAEELQEIARRGVGRP